MADLGKLTRREFLRRGLGTLITGSIVGSTGLFFSDLILELVRNSDVDDSPIAEQKIQNADETDNIFSGKLVDISIDGIPFKLYGIGHHRAFAEVHYSTMEQLVRNSSIVVSEGSPDDSSNALISNDAKSYFSTIVDLCQKYDKQIVSLDSESTFAFAPEIIIGTLSGFYAIPKSYSLLRSGITRRQLLGDIGKLLASYYLFISSLLGVPLRFTKPFFVSDSNNPQYINENTRDREKYYFNHFNDQRNVQLANRLLALPKLMKSEDFQGWDYALVVFNVIHTEGAHFYLTHPRWRQIKSALYQVSYDLIDSDGITKYVPNNGSWEKVSLR